MLGARWHMKYLPLPVYNSVMPEGKESALVKSCIEAIQFFL